MKIAITIENDGRFFEHGDYQARKMNEYETEITANIHLCVSRERPDVTEFMAELEELIARYAL